MKEETGLEESTGLRASVESAAAGDPHTEEGRHRPTWRGWALSILVAILLSVTATLLLGGSGAFRSNSAIRAVTDHNGSGAGSSCCPPADAGK